MSRCFVVPAILIVPMLLLGCGKVSEYAPPPAPTRAANASMLEPLLLPEKPAKARTVPDVRDNSKDGDEVVLEGQIPPGAVKAFLNDRAGFVLMAKADIDKNRDELDCAEPG